MTAGQAELISELARIHDRLEKLEQLYNMTTDETEIEALIYEKRAAELRRSALLRRAKSDTEPKRSS